MYQGVLETVGPRPILWAFVLAFWIILISRFARKKKASLDVYTLPANAANDLRKAALIQFREHPDRIWQLAGHGSVPGTVILPHKYVNEIGRLPEHQMSFNEEIYRRFVGKYTKVAKTVPMHNVTHVVRGEIARHSNMVIEMVLDEIELAIKEHIGTCEDWTPLPLAETLKNITAQISVRLFLGVPYCRNKELVDLFVNHVTIMREAAVALLQYPEWRRPIVAPFLKQLRTLHYARARLTTMIAPALEARRKQLEANGMEDLPADFLSWTIKQHGIQALDPETQIDYQLSTAFAAIGTTTTFLINTFLDFCVYPEYIQVLRKEWNAMLESSSGLISKQSLMTLHKTNSFMRESQRLHPVHLFVMSRCVLSDTVLSDGRVLPKDTSLALPIYAMNRDPNVWGPDAEKFDGERFEKLQQKEESGKGNGMKWTLTYADPTENINFGYGKHACPGRFLAASEAKIMIGRILTEYDLKFKDDTMARPEPVVVGSTLIPNPSTKVLFRKRKAGDDRDH